MVKLNHNHRHLAFFFASIYVTLTTSAILLYDDFLHDFLDNNNKYDDITKFKIKTVTHLLIVFIITWISTYIFYNIFKWAPAASWSNKIKLI